MQNTDNVLANLMSPAYMFDTLPKGFENQTLAFVIAVIGILLSVAAIWYFKKRRSPVEVTKETRHIASRHAKINLGIWIAFLLFWFLRTQQAQFVSMRFFLYILALASLINVITAVALAKFKKPELVSEVISTSAEDYQKYLPKKKK